MVHIAGKRSARITKRCTPGERARAANWHLLLDSSKIEPHSHPAADTRRTTHGKAPPFLDPALRAA